MGKQPHPADLANLAAIERASYFTVVLFVGGRNEKLELKTLALARQARPLLEGMHAPCSRRGLIYAVTMPDGFSHLVPDSYQPMETDMQTHTTTTGKANGKAPYAGKEPGKGKPAAKAATGKGGKGDSKLPVPGPTPAMQAASATAPRGITSPAPKAVDPATTAAIDKGLVADPKKDGIPVELQVQNRKPLTPEQAKKVEDEMAKHAKTAKTKAEAVAKSTPVKKAAPKKSKSKDGRKLYDWKSAEAAAKKGTLPKAPDFGADTHARFRPALAEVEKMAKAKDLAGLKKFKWDGALTSSPKAIMRYRALCLVALQAK